MSGVDRTAPPDRDKTVPSLQPLAVRREDAARMLGVSLRHFERHIQPNVRTVAIGGRVVVPVSELERYLQLQAI